MPVGSRAERSSSSSKRSRSSATSSVAKRYASGSVTTSARARSRSGARWRRSTGDECLQRAGGVLAAARRPRGARRGGRSARDGHAPRAGSRAPASAARRRGRRARGGARRPRSRAARTAGSPVALSALTLPRPTARSPPYGRKSAERRERRVGARTPLVDRSAICTLQTGAARRALASGGERAGRRAWPLLADDALLVGRLRDGDERAFEEAVDALYPGDARGRARLRPRRAASPRRSCRRPGSAVLKGLDRFEGRSTLRTWVLRIVANIARDRGASARRARCRSPSLELGGRASRWSSRSGSSGPTSPIPAAGGRSRPTGGRCPSRGCSRARRSTSSTARSPSCPRRSAS